MLYALSALTRGCERALVRFLAGGGGGAILTRALAHGSARDRNRALFMLGNLWAAAPLELRTGYWDSVLPELIECGPGLTSGVCELCADGMNLMPDMEGDLIISKPIAVLWNVGGDSWRAFDEFDCLQCIRGSRERRTTPRCGSLRNADEGMREVMPLTKAPTIFPQAARLRAGIFKIPTGKERHAGK